MNSRILALGLVTASASLAACSGAEDTVETVAAAPSFTYPDGSPHPVTSWGDPDLQGVWPIMHLLSTSLQRNPDYGDRRLLTDDEYAATLSGRGSQAARDAA